MLSQRLGWEPFLEGVNDNPYLADFYENMERWSFHSQIFFLAGRLSNHRQLLDRPNSVIQDRTVYEDAEIFACNLYERGAMQERDYATYRALYEAGFIDVGVIVTRTQDELRAFATQLRLNAGMPEVEAKKMLATTTTTNLEKLIPRLTRGDAGGCPILAIAISSSAYENAPTSRPPSPPASSVAPGHAV